MSRHELLIADSRFMLALQPDSIHLVVTSPPYWNIKDYEYPGQIGTGQDYQQYLCSLAQVLKECCRTIHPGCRMAINIGDQYIRASATERYHIVPVPSDIIGLSAGLQLDFLGQIIWRKISTTKTSGGGAWMGSTYWPRDGQITYEHEYILIFKKPGAAPKPSAEAKDRSKLTKEQRSAWFRGVWDDIRPTRQDRHPAAFPLELPRRLIKMYSFWGETVLDPFVGSGPTMVAAAQEGRNSVGYEINPAYLPVVQSRFHEEAGSDTELTCVYSGLE